MKTITLNVIKKNRMYFKCMTENGYEVKLKITQKSENLDIGKHELLVKDVSIRTKYGTDVIYQIEEEITNDRIVTLKHRYNRILVEKCKFLAGKWDHDAKAWVFTSIVEDEVENLDALYNSEEITIELKARQDVRNCTDSVRFLGYDLAKATGRDSGAELAEGVALICGQIKSGGSSKNWSTELQENSILRLRVPKKLLEEKFPEAAEFTEFTEISDNYLLRVV